MPLKTKLLPPKNMKIAQQSDPVLGPKKLMTIVYTLVFKILKDGEHVGSALA